MRVDSAQLAELMDLPTAAHALADDVRDSPALQPIRGFE
jgi:hypothetical protein